MLYCAVRNPAYTPLSLPPHLNKLKLASLQDMGCGKWD